MMHHLSMYSGLYSIALAALIGLARFPKVHKTFHPFIFLVTVALVPEIANRVTIGYYQGSNAVITNIYGLIEYLFWLWQFYNWNAFKKGSRSLMVLLLLPTAVWITENVILGKLSTFSSGFAILYSFCVVFLAINQVNRQIVEERKNLFSNPTFLICSGLIIFFTYRILVESFYLLDMAQTNREFLHNIFNILKFVNVFVNLLFAFAALWIPTRQRFSLPSS